MVLRKRSSVIFIVILLLLFFTQIANAEIKIVNGDCPVFISSHVMGGQVAQYPNAMYSMMGVVTGFSADKFPINVAFKTMTNFTSVARYQPVLSAIVLTDGTGKNNMTRYEFASKFDRPGAMYTQIVDWKVSFPGEGFYAFNIFVDGKLVGYYPFFVASR